VKVDASFSQVSTGDADVVWVSLFHYIWLQNSRRIACVMARTNSIFGRKIYSLAPSYISRYVLGRTFQLDKRVLVLVEVHRRYLGPLFH
jgi:hypothetical protein